MIALWYIAPSSLVEAKRRFEGCVLPPTSVRLLRPSNSTRLYGAISQKTVVFRPSCALIMVADGLCGGRAPCLAADSC
jgi:hypothetical protein